MSWTDHCCKTLCFVKHNFIHTVSVRKYPCGLGYWCTNSHWEIVSFTSSGGGVSSRVFHTQPISITCMTNKNGWTCSCPTGNPPVIEIRTCAFPVYRHIGTHQRKLETQRKGVESEMLLGSPASRLQKSLPKWLCGYVVIQFATNPQVFNSGGPPDKLL